MDPDYLQNWMVSLQSHYLLFLRSQKDGEDKMEENSDTYYNIVEPEDVKLSEIRQSKETNII